MTSVLRSTTRLDGERRDRRPPPGRARRAKAPVTVRTPGQAALLAFAVVALVAWLVSLQGVDLAGLSGWGLLTAVPPVWWVAASCPLPYLVAALGGRSPWWLLALYQTVLVLVLFGTTSATYPAPRFPWTYKHIGVVEHMLAVNGVDRSIDIYNNWPGFFVAAAAVSRITGLSPLELAQWSEPFFAGLTSIALLFALRGVTHDRRVVWTGLVFFTAANWVAQNYFAPQALAMVLALVVLGCVLRLMPRSDAEGRPVPRRGAALLTRQDRLVAQPPSVRSRAVPLVVAVLAFAGIVVTHQLTPLAVLAQVVLLVLWVRVRHGWLLPLLVAVQAAWLVSTWAFVSGRWKLFEPGAPERPDVAGATLVPSLPGMALMQRAPMLLVAVVVLLAAVAVLLLHRRGALPVAPLAFAVAPPMLVLLQPYGGEGVFRAYLFALPWLSCLIALAATRLWQSGLPGRVVPLAAGVAVAALSLPAMLGSEQLDLVPAEDVRASAWFERQLPDGAYAVQAVGTGMPLLVTASYPEHLAPPVLLNDRSGFVPGSTSGEQLLALARAAFAERGPNGYLVITGYQYQFARSWGQLSDEQLDALGSAVAGSKEYRVVYRDGRTLIARHVP